mmetsp:Transcript_4463/g.13750  ORF Transcript_4463/g.13750 Transcript_4463/m.13750 type:complete len:662 (-) Transcript_4463:763-2748(-)
MRALRRHRRNETLARRVWLCDATRRGRLNKAGCSCVADCTCTGHVATCTATSVTLNVSVQPRPWRGRRGMPARSGAAVSALRAREHLQDRHRQIEDPEADEERACGDLVFARPSKLTAQQLPPRRHHAEHDQCARSEDSHREPQVTGRHRKAAIRVEHREVGVALPPLIRHARVRPEDRADRPGQAEAKEDVHRIGPGHVAHRRVGGRLGLGGRERGKGVRERRAERDERDRRDRVGDAEHATEQPGEIADERRDDADHDERDAEGERTVAQHRRRAQGKEELPWHGERVADVVAELGRRLLILAAHGDGLDELLAPLRGADGELVRVHRRHQRHDRVHFLLEVRIVDDHDRRRHLALRLTARRALERGVLGRVGEVHVELLLLVVVSGRRDDRDPDLLDELLVLEVQPAGHGLVVVCVHSHPVARRVVDRHAALVALAPEDAHDNLAVRVHRAHVLLLEEEDAAHVVVVHGDRRLRDLDNDRCAPAGKPRKARHIRRKDLDEEVLVGLRLVVVNDPNLHRLLHLPLLEAQRALRRLVVLARLGAPVVRLVAHVNDALEVARAQDVDGDERVALGDGVLATRGKRNDRFALALRRAAVVARALVLREDERRAHLLVELPVVRLDHALAANHLARTVDAPVHAALGRASARLVRDQLGEHLL